MKLKPIYLYPFLSGIFILILVLVQPKPWINDEAQNSEPVPVVEPPLPEIMPVLVEVANRNESGLFKGYGIPVEYYGTKFIITSRTLLMPAGEVTVDGWPGSVFAVDRTSDLVALQVYAYSTGYDYDLTSEPRSGPLRLITDVSTYVTIVESDLRDGWAALESAPAGSEGAPIFQDNMLVGVFLGFNREGVPVIANTDALIRLAEQILETK